MKIGYELSNLAKDDLEKIWVYTSKKWSIDQANKYYEILVAEISFICQNPEIGRLINEIKLSHRIRLIKSHIIVYKFEANKIWIVRILHQRMDLANRINQ